MSIEDRIAELLQKADDVAKADVLAFLEERVLGSEGGFVTIEDLCVFNDARFLPLDDDEVRAAWRFLVDYPELHVRNRKTGEFRQLNESKSSEHFKVGIAGIKVLVTLFTPSDASWPRPEHQNLLIAWAQSL